MSTGAVQLRMPNSEHLYDQVFANHRSRPRMVTAGSASGRLAICGAGPSLAEQLAAVAHEPGDVWACNSALPYLCDRGVRVTHGFTIDQGLGMLATGEWDRVFDVTYLLASSVHPDLVEHLADRPLQMFHSFLGLPAPANWIERDGFGSYEDWLYRKLYDASICVGAGLNSVPRAISLAVAMGYTDIRVYGADCACRVNPPEPPTADPTPAYTAWLEQLVMYADGRSPAIYGPHEAMLRYAIDGDVWFTRTDMGISAEHLVKLDREYPGRITYVGDTLVSALQRQSDTFWADMPRLNNLTSCVENLHRPDPVGV